MKHICNCCLIWSILILGNGCTDNPDQSDRIEYSLGNCSFSIPSSWDLIQQSDTKISFVPNSKLNLGDHCRLDIVSASASEYGSSNGSTGISCNVYDELQIAKKIFDFGKIVREGEGKNSTGELYCYVISNSRALDNMVQEDGKKGEDGFVRGTPMNQFFGLVNKKNISIKLFLRGPKEKGSELRAVGEMVLRSLHF